MKLVQFIEFLRNRLKAVVWACYGVLGLVVLGDIFLVHREHGPGAAEQVSGFWAHAYNIAENRPGFWSVYGLVGCILIILLSKWSGHLGIMTREDYYDEKQPAPAAEDSHHE